jgi:hypothetical protein
MNRSQISNVWWSPQALALPSVVYKYRATKGFRHKSQGLNHIWLAKPDSFNDPFEPERIFSGTQFSEALARSVREAGMLCLCKSSSNLPMWSYYGDGLRGVALGYDLAELLATLKPVEPSESEVDAPRWKYVFDLDYRNDGLSEIDEMALLRNDELTDAERQKMFATKSKDFVHEEECRIVVEPSPGSQATFSWHGHGLYRHSPDALKEVIFGELISHQDRIAIMETLVGREVTYWNAIRDKNCFAIRLVSAAGTQ